MKLIELFEAKPKKKEVEVPAPRNFVAKYAQKSGAGSHTSKKFERHPKHKNKDKEE